MRNILGAWILGCLVVFTNSVSAKPDTLWTRTYGLVEHDYGYTVQQTFDGGYIVVGDTGSYTGNRDMYLIKTDSLGDTIWTRVYGGSRDDGCYGFGDQEVQETSDSGYIITGFTRSYSVPVDSTDLWLIKTDASGDTLWTKVYGGIRHEFGHSVQQILDGGYIIVGYTNSYGAGECDVWLLKTDALGDTIWTKTYGGTDWEQGFSVQLTADGGYIIVGAQNPGTNNVDVWLIKTDANGNLLWDKTFGGTGHDYGYCVRQTSDGYIPDGGYIIVGEAGFSGNGDAWLIKTDANGNKLWDKTFGGTYRGNCVQQTQDGGYVITGVTDGGDLWVIKTDTLGDTLWTQVYGGTDYDCGYFVQQTSDDGYIITGSTESFGIAGNADVWLIKIAPETGVEESAKFKLQDAKLECHPNPFVQSTIISYQLPDRLTTVSLRIYNVAGNLTHTLVDEEMKPGCYNINWHPNELPTGIYFAKLSTGNYNLTKKLIFIR